MTHIALYVPSVQTAQTKSFIAISVVTRSSLARDLTTKQRCNLDTQDVLTQQSTNHLLRLTKSHCCRAGISILIRKLRYRIIPTRPLKQYLHPNGFTFTNCFCLSAEFARIQPTQAISCRYQLLFDSHSSMNCVSWQDPRLTCNNARTKPMPCHAEQYTSLPDA